MQQVGVRDFDEFRAVARAGLMGELSPEELQFIDHRQGPSLLSISGEELIQSVKNSGGGEIVRVPPKFLNLGQTVACHRQPDRFHLLYRLLWRLTHGENHLLDVATDDDVHPLLMMEKAVRRDAHKMKAFVRFKRVAESHDEQFVAWHCPDHYTLRMVAPFFSRRFPTMNWAILTPDESVHWDQQQLHYGPGVPLKSASQQDVLEDLWKVYYANIFNPARVNLLMMTREMPRRHWRTLPEAEIIDQLIAEAPERVAAMVRHQEGSRITAADFLPEQRDFDSLQEAAHSCQGCDLYRSATETVFGVGPVNARLMLVGEQPGDEEDKTGQPFVGPAGEVLDRILTSLNLDRSELYITNAVKHFKFTMSGTRRLHSKPSAREVTACRPWLDSELELIRPDVLVCLGVTAAQAVIGRHFKLTQHRGTIIKTAACDQTIATYHPSALLRMPDKIQRDRLEELFTQDLTLAASLLG